MNLSIYNPSVLLSKYVQDFVAHFPLTWEAEIWYAASYVSNLDEKNLKSGKFQMVFLYFIKIYQHLLTFKLVTPISQCSLTFT